METCYVIFTPRQVSEAVSPRVFLLLPRHCQHNYFVPICVTYLCFCTNRFPGLYAQHGSKSLPAPPPPPHNHLHNARLVRTRRSWCIRRWRRYEILPLGVVLWLAVEHTQTAVLLCPMQDNFRVLIVCQAVHVSTTCMLYLMLCMHVVASRRVMAQTANSQELYYGQARWCWLWLM